MSSRLDANVIISGFLEPRGSPARTLSAWLEGNFELVVSPLLLAELEYALAYPKLRRHIPEEEARRIVEWLSRVATVAPDPDDPPVVRSSDSGDDYLLALAAAEEAVLVSGDHHLLRLPADLPIYSPARFLALFSETRD